MKFGRYKDWGDKEWAAAMTRRTQRLAGLVRHRAPTVMLEMNARLLIEAYYRGPWRAIWALIVHELQELWIWYVWVRWEWARVHVFGLKPDPILAEVQRDCDEQDALDEMVKQL